MTFVKTALFHKAGEGSGGGGGGDQHNLGWYATESALTTAHATATDGDWAIVGATDTVWVWDSDSTGWKDTGAAGIELPDQTGHSGEFLTTNGSSASWSNKPLVNTTTNTNSLAILGSAYDSSCINSIAIGNNAVVYNKDTVTIGDNSYANAQYGIAIGKGAQSFRSGGIAIGEGTHSGDTGAIVIGRGAKTTDANCSGSIAIGSGALAYNDFTVAIGPGAKVTAVRAVQIGPDTNSESGTVKIALSDDKYTTPVNYKLMDADGTIPTARLTKVNTTVTLTAAGWSGGSQTVTVNGVTSTSVVFVAPDPADTTDYVSAGILCTTQGTNSLTFTATTTPSADIDVVVVAM